MVVTLRDRISQSLWWVVSLAITAYLFVGISYTIKVLFG